MLNICIEHTAQMPPPAHFTPHSAFRLHFDCNFLRFVLAVRFFFFPVSFNRANEWQVILICYTWNHSTQNLSSKSLGNNLVFGIIFIFGFRMIWSVQKQKKKKPFENVWLMVKFSIFILDIPRDLFPAINFISITYTPLVCIWMAVNWKQWKLVKTFWNFFNASICGAALRCCCCFFLSFFVFVWVHYSKQWSDQLVIEPDIPCSPRKNGISPNRTFDRAGDGKGGEQKMFLIHSILFCW